MKTSRKKTFILSIFAGNLIMIIIPVFVVALVVNYAFHTYLARDIAQKDKMMLYNVKQNVASFLRDAENTLEFVSLTADSRSGEALDREIARINQIKSYFENIEIIDAEGYVVNTLPVNKNQLGHNRSGEEYYAYLDDSGDSYWSVPFISAVSGEPTVTVALKGEDRIVVGYLNLNYLSVLTGQFVETDPDLKALILDGYGRYIAGSDINMVRQRQLEPYFSKLRANTSTTWPIEFMRSDERLGFSMKTESPDWYLVIYDEITESMKKINALLNLFLFLISASVLSFALLSLLRASKIKQHIDQFLRQTETLAAGNFQVDFPDQKYDEFHKLAENFRAMAETLEARDKELERMAYTDSLTGFKNKAYLYELGWMEEPSGAEMFGMIYLDIDNFKNINDSYGHTLGDDLLITVSERLRGCIGEDVIVTRFGGDEFVLIVPDDRSLQFTHETIDKLIDTFKTPFFIDERGFFVTVSMGISVSEREGYDFDLMLKAADIAMYQAKESGKNNYMFYDPEMDRKIKRRLLIEMNLRNALDDEEFSLVYQPQILAKSGKVRGFEALIRWNNKELGQVSPLDFIPVAEETGMIEKIGKWVIQSACETIRTINSVNRTDYIMSINVSPVQIGNPFFLTDLYEIIQETGIKNEWIEIEITENVFLANVEEVISIILHLTSKGILISLDDFGTGYSSLSYLNKLPIDTLKIDREFIRNLIHDKDDQKMVESIVLLAHKLGIFLVAEGVENQSQVRLLNDFSCDCIQGFYFSKPLQSDALLELIESGNLDSEIKSKY